MAYYLSFKQRKIMAERRRAKARALKAKPREFALHKRFTLDMSRLHFLWKQKGDDEAMRLYMGALGRIGKGRKKWAAGKLGGLQTKTVKRKPYVKGELHGNTGTKKPRKSKEQVGGLQFTPEESLEQLQARIAYYLENPGAHQTLTWEPEWQPPSIPQDVPVIDDRGNILQRGVPPGGTEKNT